MLPPPTFHRQLAAVCLLCGLGLGLFYFGLPDLRTRVVYMAALLVGFAGFTWAAQAIAERLARHPNPSVLLNFVLALTGAKMFLALTLVYAYMVIAKPETLAYLAPFAWVYVVYTSFETYALVKLNFATAPKKTAARAEDAPR